MLTKWNSVAARRWALGAGLAAALLCGALPAQARGPSKPWTGQVTRVVDGDSVWVRPAQGGAPRRLRLLGIDAPEICQEGGPQARDALRSLLQGQTVQVSVRASDGYGRLLAQVVRQTDGKDAAAWMAQSGWAWSPGFRGQPGLYAPQEAAARQAARGLFAQPGALLPADFRREHGLCQRSKKR